MAAAEATLGTRTMRGMVWAYGSYAGGRVLVLISTVILARLLSPADFGLVALALTFMVFLDTVRDLGLGQALIVAPEEDLRERAQTVFGWSLLLGAALSLATAALAPAAGAFFGASGLTPLLAVLGLNFVVRSLGTTHYELARRALDFRSRTIAETADVTIRGTLGIALALLGFGAWSLVLAYLVGSVGFVVAIWLRVRFRPVWRLTRDHLRELVTFGGTLTLVDIGQAFAHEIDYLFIGRVLGVASLGIYSIGFRLPELLIVNLAIVAGNVLFPAYSMLDRERLREAFLTSLRYTALLVGPMAVGLALLAKPVVLVLFGAKWSGAVPVMQILAAYAVVVTLNVPAGTVYKVTGRAWILVAFTVPYIATLFGALLIFTPSGIVAVAGVMAGLQGAFAVAGWTVACRVLDVEPRRILAALAGPAAAVATMAAALGLVVVLVDGNAATLACGIVVAALAYGVGVGLFARDAVLAVLGALPSRTERRSAPAASHAGVERRARTGAATLARKRNRSSTR
jgi:O-antigen/teichoic acid export membrane protein